MKYKCHVNECKFEGAFTKLILHAIEVHKVDLTEYFLNWMKSNGENPIEICKNCGNKIKLNFPYEDYKISKELNNLNPLGNKFTRKSKFLRSFYSGFCSIKCSSSYNTRIQMSDNNNREKCIKGILNYAKSDIGRSKSKDHAIKLHELNKGRKHSHETIDKISASVKKAIDEGRLDPIFNATNSPLVHRPNKNISEWISKCKLYLNEHGISNDEKLFINKIKLLTNNIGIQIYLNLGTRYKFLDYLFFYKMHKINIEIDGDNCHNINCDLLKDKLIYEKYNILTLRINNIASRKITINQLIQSIDELIDKGPYWNFCKTIEEIYDWKWLVRFNLYKTCKRGLLRG